ncbi:MAG TPA: hypothetical protein VGD69_32500 [Herpetosiphonaceae bacterium]
MRRLLPVLLVLLPLTAFAAPVRQAPPVQTGSWTHSEVNDWLPGSFTNTFVDGSVLRLQDGQTSGEYISAPLQAPFGFNAGLVAWSANVGADQGLTLQVRSSTDGQTWDEWRTAQSVAQQQGRDLSQVVTFRLFTSWLQYRVALTAQSASPSLDEIKLTYLSSTAGPRLVDIVGRVPLLGPPTLTPAPEAISRVEWAGPTTPATRERQQPRQIELVQLLVPADDPNPVATLRALRWVSQNVQGQPELPYHYVIDAQGNIYESSGSVSNRIDGASEGAVRIAVLANVEAEGVSEAAQARLVELFGWLSSSYRIASEQISAATGSPQRLTDLIAELRPTIDQAVVRSRTIFAEGNTTNATERIVFFNTGADEARTTLTAFTPGGEERRSVVVPPRQRVDVTLNSTLPEPTSLGLDLQSNRAVLAERTLIVGRELMGSGGAAEPARAWYFGEGTTITDTQTVLLVVNPQRQEVAATLTFYPDGTAPITRSATFAPRSRSTLLLNDLLPDAQFGLKLVASQPVAAERSVFFGSGAAHLITGVSDLSRHWSFAEGSTTVGFTTTLHLLNPWPQQVAISLQIMSEDGTSLSRRYALAPESRFVLTLNDVVPDLPFAMEVQAERPIAAERTMLIENGAAASATAGAPEAATRWTFVEGSTAAPAEEFLLISNANRDAVDLAITYVLSEGRVEQRSHTIPGMARLTISVNADVPEQPVVTAIVTADRPVVAERSIFTGGPQGRGAETSVGVPGR